MTTFRYLRALALALLLGCVLAAPARAQTAPAQTIWRLLDYIAVDYAGTVSDGRVVNEAEYVEMVEFSASVRQRLGELAPTEARANLLQGAKRLEADIAAKAAPESIATSARQLGRVLLAAYRVHVNLRNRQAADYLGCEFGNARYSAISEASAPRGKRAFMTRQASNILPLFRFGDQIAITQPRTANHRRPRHNMGAKSCVTVSHNGL